MKSPNYPYRDVLLLGDLIMVRKLVREWDWQPFARLTPEDEWEMLPASSKDFARAAETAMVYVHQQCQRQN
jgi:hypothetical protein